MERWMKFIKEDGHSADKKELDKADVDIKLPQPSVEKGTVPSRSALLLDVVDSPAGKETLLKAERWLSEASRIAAEIDSIKE